MRKHRRGISLGYGESENGNLLAMASAGIERHARRKQRRRHGVSAENGESRRGWRRPACIAGGVMAYENGEAQPSAWRQRLNHRQLSAAFSWRPKAAMASGIIVGVAKSAKLALLAIS